MTSISKDAYINKLDDIVKKNNNTYHRTIKMKLVNVKSKTYINFNKEDNYKDSKLEVHNYVRLSRYKNIFEKVYVPNWSEEIFVIKKVKITVPWTYLIEDLKKKLLELFTKKGYKKQIKKNLG